MLPGTASALFNEGADGCKRLHGLHPPSSLSPLFLFALSSHFPSLSLSCRPPLTGGVAAHGGLGAGVVRKLQHSALAVGAGGDGDDVLQGGGRGEIRQPHALEWTEVLDGEG